MWNARTPLRFGWSTDIWLSQKNYWKFFFHQKTFNLGRLSLSRFGKNQNTATSNENRFCCNSGWLYTHAWKSKLLIHVYFIQPLLPPPAPVDARGPPSFTPPTTVLCIFPQRVPVNSHFSSLFWSRWASDVPLFFSPLWELNAPYRYSEPFFRYVL